MKVTCEDKFTERFYLGILHVLFGNGLTPFEFHGPLLHQEIQQNLLMTEL